MESGSLVLTGVLLGSVLWHCTAGVYLTGEAASVDHILTTRTGACVVCSVCAWVSSTPIFPLVVYHISNLLFCLQMMQPRLFTREDITFPLIEVEFRKHCL